MAVLADGRFWAGVILGLVAFYAWMRFQAKKAA